MTPRGRRDVYGTGVVDREEPDGVGTDRGSKRDDEKGGTNWELGVRPGTYSLPVP